MFILLPFISVVFIIFPPLSFQFLLFSFIASVSIPLYKLLSAVVSGDFDELTRSVGSPIESTVIRSRLRGRYYENLPSLSLAAHCGLFFRVILHRTGLF